MNQLSQQNQEQEATIIKATKPILLHWLDKQEGKLGQLLDDIQCTTVEEAIKIDSSVLAQIAVLDRDAAVRILTILIGETILYFNVGKTMGPPQLKIVIDMLLKDPILKNMKPEDYKVLFTDMKKGYYGNLYDRFDGQIIFQNALKYADNRASIIENESIQQHRSLKDKQDNQPVHPDLIPYLTKIGNNLPKDQPPKVFSKDLVKPENYEEDEKTKYIKECFNSFELEFRRAPVKTSLRSDKFITYKGKPVDQAEFVKLKLEEKYPNENTQH